MNPTSSFLSTAVQPTNRTESAADNADTTTDSRVHNIPSGRKNEIISGMGDGSFMPGKILLQLPQHKSH